MRLDREFSIVCKHQYHMDRNSVLGATVYKTIIPLCAGVATEVFKFVPLQQ